MRWQTIDFEMMDVLDVNIQEYLLLNLVYAFSTNPHAPVPGWCNASTKSLANFLRIGQRTVERYLSRMSATSDESKHFPLIIKNGNGQLRKTSKSYNKILLKYQNEGKPARRNHRQTGGSKKGGIPLKKVNNGPKSRRNGGDSSPNRRKDTAKQAVVPRHTGGSNAATLADYVYKDVSIDVESDVSLSLSQELNEELKNRSDKWLNELIETGVSIPQKFDRSASFEKFRLKLLDEKKYGEPSAMTFDQVGSRFKGFVISWIQVDSVHTASVDDPHQYEGAYET